MANKTKPIQLTFEQVVALMNYHQGMYASIPVSIYKQRNMSGTTMEDTAKKHLTLSNKFNRLLNETWLK